MSNIEQGISNMEKNFDVRHSIFIIRYSLNIEHFGASVYELEKMEAHDYVFNNLEKDLKNKYGR